MPEIRPLRQSTAKTVKIGQYLDYIDAYTPKTALTLTQGDFMLSKANGAFAQKNEPSAGTHDANGWYNVALNGTDTGTLELLIINSNEAGAGPVTNYFWVYPANVYDSMFGTTDALQVDVRYINDVAAGTTTAQLGVVAITGTVNLNADQTGVRIGTVNTVLGGTINTTQMVNAGTVNLNPDQTAVRIGTVGVVSGGTVNTVQMVLAGTVNLNADQTHVRIGTVHAVGTVSIVNMVLAGTVSTSGTVAAVGTSDAIIISMLQAKR